MKPTLLLILASLLACASLQAQTDLEFAPNTFSVTNLRTGISDSGALTIRVGDTLEFFGVIQNTSGGTLSGIFGLGIARDTINGPGADTLFAPNAPFDTLSNGDTVGIRVRDVVDTTLARYSGGTGGGAILVVVWPARTNGTPGSSSIASSGVSLTFDGPNMSLSRRFLSAQHRDMYHPNPFSTHLRLHPELAHLPVEGVRIWSLGGQEMYRASRLPSGLSTSHWPNGLYLIELREASGQRHWQKLRKGN
jgi:hypothetical protein